MKLMDTYTGEAVSLPALYDEWRRFRSEEPWNHAPVFRTEFFCILLATINGRNDLDIVGMTPAEASRYIIRLGNLLGLYAVGVERK